MTRYDYDGGYRYDRGFRGAPAPYTGWVPGAFWAGMPVYGWGAWEWPLDPGPMAYPVRPPDRFGPRRPPRESPTYGRGGDAEVRRWAERHGYDAGYAIPPRRPRYDDPYRRRYDRW